MLFRSDDASGGLYFKTIGVLREDSRELLLGNGIAASGVADGAVAPPAQHDVAPPHLAVSGKDERAAVAQVYSERASLGHVDVALVVGEYEPIGNRIGTDLGLKCEGCGIKVMVISHLRWRHHCPCHSHGHHRHTYVNEPFHGAKIQKKTESKVFITKSL